MLKGVHLSIFSSLGWKVSGLVSSNVRGGRCTL